MSNVVAFSLYGIGAKYLVGAVENVKLVRQHYPGWEAHVWVKPDVPMKVCDALANEGAVVHSSVCINGMFDRFLAHDLPGVERYLIRDVDSRINPREVKAVKEWIAAGTVLHSMRDHPFHNQPLMGCSWGYCKQGYGDFNMLKLSAKWSQDTRYGRDQDFLAAVIWPMGITRTVHDSCGAFDFTRNWPSDGPAFVGEYIDEFGRPNYEHRVIRSNWLRYCEAKNRGMVT